MSNSRDAFLFSAIAAVMASGENACVNDVFGGAYFGFYFGYFNFSQSLPAGQGIV
jgi:hypothetical protein